MGKKVFTATVRYRVEVDPDGSGTPMANPSTLKEVERFLRDNLGVAGYMRHGMDIQVLVPPGEE